MALTLHLNSDRVISRLVGLIAGLAATLALMPVARAVNEVETIRSVLVTAHQEHRSAYDAFNFSEAVAAARRGLALAEQTGDLADQAPFLRHLAYDHWALGDNETALDFCGRVLEAAEKLQDHSLRSSGHRYLSLIYESLGDFSRSRQHASRALHFAKLTDDESLRILALSSLARCQVHDQQLGEAERAYQECHAYWEGKGNRRNAANVAAHLAELVALRGQHAEALRIYEGIFAVRADLKDPYGQTQVVVAIAELLRREGRHDEALRRLLAVQTLAKSTESNRILAEYYGILSRAQEACGDFRQALASERLSDTAHDEMITQIARGRALELESRVATAQQERAVEHRLHEVSRQTAKAQLQEQETLYQHNLRVALVGDGLLTVMLVVLIFVRRSRTRNALALAPAGSPPTGT